MHCRFECRFAPRVIYETSEQVRRIIVERGLDRLLKDEVIVQQPVKRKS